MNDKIFFKQKIKENKYTIALLSVLNVLTSATIVLFSWLTKYVIDSIETSSFLSFTIVLIVVVVLEIVFKLLSSFLSTRKINQFEQVLKQDVFHEMLKKNYKQIKDQHDSSLLSYIISDCRLIAESVITLIPNIVSLLSKIILAFILLFFIDVVFACILLVCGLLMFLITRFLRKKNKVLHAKMQQAEAKQMGFYQESIINLILLKVFDKRSLFHKRENKINDAVKKSKNEKMQFNIFVNSGFLFVMRLSYLFAILYGVFYLNHGISIGDLFAMVQLISHIEVPFSNLSGLMPKYYSTLASIDRILMIYQLQDENKKHPLLSFSTIDFHDVCFSFEDKKIIDHFSFQIQKNDFVLIKGESGAGKSTLLHLLLGLYHPTSGKICFDNETQTCDCEKMFAFVPQRSFIFEGTMKENLIFFNDQVEEEQIQEVLQIVGLTRFKNQLNSYIYDLNQGMSEGEIQRLCIARALLTNRPILIFDEATSALDSQNEALLLKNLSKLQKTILFISHKDKTQEYANKVIELKKID